MQALFIFFLIRHLLFTEKDAYLIFGAYAAMVYMMPVLGGFVADRYLGARKSITFGAVMVTLGHLTLAVEGPAAVHTATGVARDPFYLTLFFLALAQIVVGVSFVKTSCMTLVGAIYGPEDPRRDAGFTLYYMSINIGGATAPILCGWAASAYGFRWGFALAALGMLIGLYAFRRGQKHIADLAAPPPGAQLDKVLVAGVRREWLIYTLAFAAVMLVSLVLRHPSSVGILIALVGGGMAAVIVHDVVFRCDSTERGKLIACAVLLVFTIGFWAFYQQMATSLSLFADRYVDRRVLGYEVSAPMLQAVPGILVLLLAPLFSRFWLALARRGHEPSTTSKFAFATLFLALGFLTVGSAAWLTGAQARVPLVSLFLTFALFVAGELSLAPMSQSMVTKLAPRRIVSLMVGGLLLSNSASVYLTSLIADVPGGNGSAGYATFYTRLGLFALGMCLVLTLIRPVMKRLTEEVSPS